MTRRNLFRFLVLAMLGIGVFYGCMIAYSDGSPLWGVKIGDTNTYLYGVTLLSNDTNTYLYTNPTYNYYLPIDTAQMLVTNVSDTNITAQFTYYFKNGTTDTVTRWSDLNYISDWEMMYFMPLNSTGFNETVTRTYVGTSRLVNRLCRDFDHSFTQMWEFNGTDYSWTYNFTVDYCWDNATGTLAEYTTVATSGNGEYYSEMAAHVVVIESNILPELRAWIVLVIPLAATLLGVIILQKRIRASFRRTSSSWTNLSMIDDRMFIVTKVVGWGKVLSQTQTHVGSPHVSPL